MPSESPFEPEELAGVLLPMGQAATLPGRAYSDPAVFAFERDAWFSRDWLYVGRASDAGAPGAWFIAPLTAAGVLVVRDAGGALRAFHNVCRHRGATLVGPAPACGTGASHIGCPYHGWTYALDGRLVVAPGIESTNGIELRPVRLEELGGFLFASLAWDTPPLLQWLDDLPAQLDGIPTTSLAVGHTTRTEVAANWKLLMENFAESYHFGPVHPQLEAKTPSALAVGLESRGPWQGGYMPLAEGFETVSTDGRRHGRVPLRKFGPRKKGALDYLLFPNLFLSLQPDYLLSYRLEPMAHDRTRVVFEVLFDPGSAQEGSFDAPDVYDFWQLTNSQDFSICERQQQGVSSPGYLPGKYTSVEEGVHEFDKIVAARYADP
jgi:phenylpropionate dioxygenase-like ring-hydroxylating dioxygenase large terminal subunit